MNLDDVFWDGFDAYKNGILRHKNPHPKYSKEFISWDKGWEGGDLDTNINNDNLHDSH